MRRGGLLVAVIVLLGVGACRKAQREAAEPTPAPPVPTRPPTAAAPAGQAEIAAFWAWFQKNAALLRTDSNLRHTMESVSEELEKINPGVIAEIGGLREGRKLVISADGKRELFPIVQQIHAARPNVPGWTIVAFRPRSEPGPIKMDGKEIDPRRMKFTSAVDGDKLDIVVFVPGFTTLEDLGVGAFIVLDHLVGEYDMETKIGAIEWAAIDRAPARARPLAELPAQLDKAFPPRR